LPQHELHDEKNRVSVLDDVVKHDDIRVVEARHHLGLTGNRLVTGADFFYSDPAAEDCVVGQINNTRPASSQQAV
jgi:hypothetical protein